ncbi:MAG TPA: glucodextranase DOMON-like domain-containing protein, partial [Candidatus Omnitrophota bacterium]|nr:glucodextranase DOMON-like domain-containing protein [Candidatus Omnitrophota bacterium]
REIYKEADDWHGGGGEATTSDDGVDPDYFDLASPNQNTQEIELSSYKPNAPAGDSAAFAEIKKSFLQVKFSPYLQVAK